MFFLDEDMEKNNMLSSHYNCEKSNIRNSSNIKRAVIMLMVFICIVKKQLLCCFLSKNRKTISGKTFPPLQQSNGSFPPM